MDYYLISPRVDGQTTEGFIEAMFQKSIVMMGYGTDNPIGRAFSQIKNGDFIIVAQRVKWEFNYYFAGIVSGNTTFMVDGRQCKKIVHLVDLRKSKCDYLANVSFAEMSTIKALTYINPSNKDTIQKLNTIINNQISMEKYIDLLISNHNLILTGAPGTGKTYLAKQIANELGAEGERYGFVQFHPSYDYTDFVEGLRPIKNNQSKEIGFERKDGIFMSFCRKALRAYKSSTNKQDAPKYVFVIDEINRGEMSKILGEMFFSIDNGYRGADGCVSTQYSNLWTEEDIYDETLPGDKKYQFYIPENVYIIGTMNDIDRSVESMDFAMRRRFAFKEVKADTRIEMINEKPELHPYFDEIKERMTNLNLCILTIPELSSAYQIGGAYFLKLRNYLDNGQLNTTSWEMLWENHLYGLLFEYLRGVPDQLIQLQTLKKAFDRVDSYVEKNETVEKVNPSDNE